MRAPTAALAAGLALAVVLGGLTDRWALLAAVALLQTLLAAVWLGALAAPGAGVGRLVVAGAGLAADATVLAADESRPMAGVGPVLALSLVAALAHQLGRRHGRADLTASLTAVVTGAVVAVFGAAWLAIEVSQAGTPVLVLAAVTAAAAPLADLAAAAWPARGTVAVTTGLAGGALVAAALVAAVVAAAVSDLGLGPAVVVGLGAAVAGRLGVVVGHRVPRPHPVLPAVLPLLLAGPVGYLLGRLLLG